MRIYLQKHPHQEKLKYNELYEGMFLNFVEYIRSIVKARLESLPNSNSRTIVGTEFSERS